MPRTREIDRERARVYRATKIALANEETRVRRERLTLILEKVMHVLAHEEFVELAISLGVDSAPRRLLRTGLCHQGANQNSQAERVLDFVVAWKFVFPMLSNPEFLDYFDGRWPGFVEDLKDTFIGLVMNGPFLSERRAALSTSVFQ